MKDIIMLLKQHGYKITPQRRAVINTVVASEEFLTAQHIWTKVKENYPTVSFDTIYRNISLLVKLGLLNEISKPTAGSVYELATTHHHHMICQNCGCMECIDCCPLDEAVLAEASGKGFEITSHRVEFYGRCSKCRAKEDGKGVKGIVKKNISS